MSLFLLHEKMKKCTGRYRNVMVIKPSYKKLSEVGKIYPNTFLFEED
jgi:hypothetical protein